MTTPNTPNIAHELARDYAALRSQVGAVRLARNVVRATGADAASYLHGQLSQDITGLASGATTWSFVLQPHGKVDALVRVHRVSADHFVLDVDGGYGQALLERLTRFKIHVKVELELLDWEVIALRGPAAAELQLPPRPSDADADVGTGVLVVDVAWPGMEGYDLLGADVDVPADVAVCSSDAYEALRIEAGLPRLGHELDERTIPAEVGINDRTVSFTKGCYTGQELVARIDSRGGNVPRHLRVLVIHSADLPPAHAQVLPTGSNPRSGTIRPLGTLCSVACSPGFGAFVALGFIRRDSAAATNAIVKWNDHAVAADILPFPISPPIPPIPPGPA